MALEDELGAIMRSHDDEAPRAAELAERPWAASSRRRRRFVLPLAAAAAVLVIGGGVAVVVRHGDSTKPPPAAESRRGATSDCPSRYLGLDGELTKPWVPAKPRGVDTGGRLVPDVTPSSVLICTYTGAPPRDGKPSRGPQKVERTTFHGDLAVVRAELTWLPPLTPNYACAGTGLLTDDSAALVRLRYPGGGTVWVGAPGRDCATSSNGRTDVADVYESVATAVRTDRWPAAGRSDDSGPCVGTTGRFGQQDTLVPRTPTRATVCTVRTVATRTGGNNFRTIRKTPLTGRHLTDLVTRLGRLPTTHQRNVCDHGSKETRRFVVRFTYPVGPPVSVLVETGDTCFGDLSNGTLRSASSATVLPLLERLTR